MPLALTLSPKGQGDFRGNDVARLFLIFTASDY